MRCDPSTDLVDDGTREAVASPRSAEHGSRVDECRKRSLPRAVGCDARDQRGKAFGRRVDVLSAEAGKRPVDFARGSVVATVQLAAENQAHAHSRADRQEREIVDPARDAEPALSQGREVDVVLERDAKIEPFA